MNSKFPRLPAGPRTRALDPEDFHYPGASLAKDDSDDDDSDSDAEYKTI